MDYEIRDADGARVGGYTGASRHFVHGLDDVFRLTGEEVVLDVWDVTELASLDVTLSAGLVDACGRELEASRAVTLVEE